MWRPRSSAGCSASPFPSSFRAFRRPRPRPRRRRRIRSGRTARARGPLRFRSSRRAAAACGNNRGGPWKPAGRHTGPPAYQRALPSPHRFPIMRLRCRKGATMRKATVILMAIGLALTMAGPANAADQGGAVGGSSSSLFAAAERGDPRAQTRIGFMYETGRGLPQDYMLAAAWYQRAAQQGYPRAQQLLGLLYDKGQGVAEDYVTAHTWLNLAAAGAGHRERVYYLRLRNSVGSKMTVAQITEAQWRARHWRPGPTP